MENITFERLYEKYYTDIVLSVQYANRLSADEAEDITTEAFVRLLEIWRDFEPKAVLTALVWLRKTACNLTYNRNRKKERLPTVSIEEIAEPADRPSHSDDLEPYRYEAYLDQIKRSLTREE